jgi:hypothetical protein
MTLIGPINAFIHIVMYGYYFITTMWPQYKDNIWWKKYLTQMQMVLSLNIYSLACGAAHEAACPLSTLAPHVPAQFKSYGICGG